MSIFCANHGQWAAPRPLGKYHLGKHEFGKFHQYLGSDHF